ncbi:hypothetical protein K439DRAFT_239619 [Ramaria rubella]|nr:hypothetical protein K439DRAFT_239619 [Ramaria rubella]
MRDDIWSMGLVCCCCVLEYIPRVRVCLLLSMFCFVCPLFPFFPLGSPFCFAFVFLFFVFSFFLVPSFFFFAAHCFFSCLSFCCCLALPSYLLLVLYIVALCGFSTRIRGLGSTLGCGV